MTFHVVIIMGSENKVSIWPISFRMHKTSPVDMYNAQLPKCTIGKSNSPAPRKELLIEMEIQLERDRRPSHLQFNNNLTPMPFCTHHFCGKCCFPFEFHCHCSDYCHECCNH